MGEASLNWSPHSEKQAAVMFSDKRITIAGTGIQWGKGVWIDELVLTPNGYVKAKKIKLGDELIDRNGYATTVIGVYLQGERECYRIDLTDRKSFIVDDQHLNIIKRRGYAKEEIITTRDLYHRNAIWEGRSKPQIPAAEPIKYGEKEYIISPYIMGVLLGDGGITSSIIISSMDDELIQRVRSELPFGYQIKKKGPHGCDWTVTNINRKHNDKGHCVNALKNTLRRFGLFGKKSNSKFIPLEYKIGSIKQRVDLLNGLMDTDGWADKNKKMEYFSVSEQLADDVIELVEGLGGKAWKAEKQTSFTHKGEKKQGQLCYRVNIILPRYNPFWLPRKAEKYFVHENTVNKLIKHIEPVGMRETVCFKVDSPTETFIINGQVVTHNTACGVMRLKVDMHKYTDPEDNFIVTSPTYKILYQSTLPPFLKWNSDIGHYNKKDEMFEIYGGGKVWFRTNQNPDSVVGITRVRHILCDEAGLYGRYFWDNVQARSSFKQCPITIVTSPYSLNWLYTDFIRPYINGDENIRNLIHLCQARSDENPYFPREEYELRRQTMDARRFNMIYGGSFDKAEGLVYDCFNQHKHVIERKKLPSGTRYFAGVDWGFTDPTVITVRAVTEDGIHFQVDESYKTQQRLSDTLDEAYRLSCLYGIEKFYADPSRPDAIAEFNKNGLRCIPAQNEILPGIERHYELIKSDEYFVFKDCKYSIDEYETYHYPDPKDLKPNQDQGHKLIMPVDQMNHSMDGQRYLTMALYTMGRSKNQVKIADKPSPIPAKVSANTDLQLKKLMRTLSKKKEVL